MKYLIFGLGNMDIEYDNTRHNVGFKALDHFANKHGLSFKSARHADYAEYSHKGRRLMLLKPSTYVNLSGKAVNYWMQKEKVPQERIMVIVDDVALPFGAIRIKAKGGDGGHNGLAHINRMLGRQNYPRLRFGIGNDYPPGAQISYVLGAWTEEQEKQLPERLDKVAEVLTSFPTIGLERTMNFYNGK